MMPVLSWMTTASHALSELRQGRFLPSPLGWAIGFCAFGASGVLLGSADSTAAFRS